MMGLFNNKKKCDHKWKIKEKSNALQLDYMGYPCRLFLVECEKCGKSDQKWLDVSISDLDELETGESFLLKWKVRKEGKVVTYEEDIGSC